MLLRTWMHILFFCIVALYRRRLCGGSVLPPRNPTRHIKVHNFRITSELEQDRRSNPLKLKVFVYIVPKSLYISSANVVTFGAGFFASIPDCRACDSPRTVHPECMPIPVPRGDHHYPQVNHSTGERLCFSFMRSLPGQQHLGKWGSGNKLQFIKCQVLK